MSGSSGAATPQVQTTSTQTDLPSWYNAITQQLGNQIGSQVGGMNAINQNFLNGGTAPTNGVFNGGATTSPYTQPVQPSGAAGPFGSMTNVPFAGNPSGYVEPAQSYGGNGMGAGIGSGVAKGMSSGGALTGYGGSSNQ